MNTSRTSSYFLTVLIAFGFCVAAYVPQSAASTGFVQSSAAKPASNPDALENDESLNLTPEQKDKIKSLREDAKSKKQDVEKDKTLTPDQQTKQVKQITKETRAQVFAVLTPEQQKAWSEEQRERRQQKKQSSQ
jgi:Spy/CpxP family protein refolding chaperone